jgi:xanthine dehydrogenase accessory factor
MRDVLEALLDEIRSGRAAVLATVVRSSGSTPRTAGAKMMIGADASTVGTIGGGAFEAMVIEDAADLIHASEEPNLIKKYDFTEKGENALGMACGGSAEVFLERVGPGDRLVIFGAGHVGLALARLAVTVGFLPELVDDRPEACEAALQAGVGSVHPCDPEYREGVPSIDPSCSIAIVTRCHRTDRLALRRVADAPCRYLGLIGSKRKKQVVLDQLREDGVTDEQLARIRCPIGLPLGGNTPEEIAVSIVAELLQTRNSTP